MINRDDFVRLANEAEHYSVEFLKTFLTELKKIGIKKYELEFDATWCALQKKLGYKKFIEFYKSI